MSRPMRNVNLGPSEVILDTRADGTILAKSPRQLGSYPDRLTERLEHWAAVAPQRRFIAQRDAKGEWRWLTYAETLDAVRNIGQSLLGRNLSPERPVVILSGNDIEHALLGLACMYVGVPYAPVSPAYSLVSSDHSKLRSIFSLLTPGLVFTAKGSPFAPALASVTTPEIEVVVTADPPADRAATAFTDLLATTATPAVSAAHAGVGLDTIAKFLFTSGSTGMPKGVINTHRMLCSNQEMLRACLAFLADAPPVLVDWLPWNHTAGGNNNFGLVLFNGGTLYIDEGKPTPKGIAATVRNLREVAPTLFFNVPKGYEALIPFFRQDEGLRRTFFSRLQTMFYSGAGLSQHVWEALENLALETCGERIIMLTGLGCTESAPNALCCGKTVPRAGVVGLPMPGIELKLIPTDGRYEARLRGPNITPGYWRQDDLTRAAFDEEGFYRLGDALHFLDPAAPDQGLVFDGRISEDFKLATGTWVAVGRLRTQFNNHFAPYVSDMVIAGHDRDDLGALIFPDIEHCRTLAPDLAADASATEVLAHPAVRSRFKTLLIELAERGTGSSTRIVRAALLDEPPSLDAHEVTDKGALNQRAVLTHRAVVVEDLYSPEHSSRILVIDEGR